MQNGLSIYQSKYCKTMFLALPCLSYKIFNRPGVGKATVLSRNRNKPIIITELQLNTQSISISVVVVSIKIWIKRKKTAAS